MAMHPPLNVERIQSAIADSSIGADLRYFPEVDSTNRVAREFRGEWRHGTVILTDYQEAGRGRRGRIWTAPPRSSVLLSAVLRPPAHVRPVDTVMVAGLSVADSVRRETGLSVALKWPNDVLVGGRKVCGILAEGERQEGSWIILGVGINGNFDPREHEGIPESATSLLQELGRAVDREALTVTLLKSLDLWYHSLTHNPDDVFSAWASRLHTVGRPVTVVDQSGAWHGVATGVSRDGGLLVRDDTGEVRTVYAADVSIRDLRASQASPGVVQ